MNYPPGQITTRRPLTRRAGSVTLELILNLPIWMIFLLAAIQFGQLNSNLQQVALAGRIGAEEAAERAITGVETATPVEIIDVVTRQLQTAGVLGPTEAPCDVILEHNVGGNAVELHAVAATCTCEPPANAVPGVGTYTRVTVCVPFTSVAPNLLSGFCLDMSSRVVQSSTTYSHEL